MGETSTDSRGVPKECSKSKRRRESVSKEGNRSREQCREGYAEGLGMQNCSRKLPEGPGPTHSLVGRVPKARGPEGSQMLTTVLSLCGLSWALKMPPGPSSLDSAGFGPT